MLHSLLENLGYVEKKSDKYLNVLVHIPKCAGGTMAYHIAGKYGQEKSLDPDSIGKSAIARVLSSTESRISEEKWKENSWFMKRSWLSVYIHSLTESQREAINCIYGHLAYYGIHENFNKQPRYFVFLREPVARFVSLYNYMLTVRVTPERLMEYEIQKANGHIRSLEEWLEEANLNYYSMTGFLSQMCNAENLLESYYLPSQKDLEDVKQMLARFYFIGLTENEDDIEFIYNRLGIANYLPDAHVLGKKSTYIRPRSYEDAKKNILSKCPFDQELYEYAIQLNREMKKQIKEYDRAVVYTRFRRNISRNSTRIFLQINERYKKFSNKARRLSRRVWPGK